MIFISVSATPIFDVHITCRRNHYRQDTGATNQWRRGFLLVQDSHATLGLLSPRMVPLFGTPKQTPSKNREKDGALVLGGRHSMMTHNNQLGVGGRSGRDVGEEACGG